MEAGIIMLSIMFAGRKLKYFQCPELGIPTIHIYLCVQHTVKLKPLLFLF